MGCHPAVIKQWKRSLCNAPLHAGWSSATVQGRHSMAASEGSGLQTSLSAVSSGTVPVSFRSGMTKARAVERSTHPLGFRQSNIHALGLCKGFGSESTARDPSPVVYNAQSLFATNE